MPERKLVIVEIECEICGGLIVSDALADERLVPFVRTKSFCNACREKENRGSTADLDMRDRLANLGRR